MSDSAACFMFIYLGHGDDVVEGLYGLAEELEVTLKDGDRVGDAQSSGAKKFPVKVFWICECEYFCNHSKNQTS